MGLLGVIKHFFIQNGLRIATRSKNGQSFGNYMAHWDGLLKTKKLKIPCIFVSADTSKDLKFEAIEADAYTLISKPINKEIIKYAVEQLLEKYYWK